MSLLYWQRFLGHIGRRSRTDTYLLAWVDEVRARVTASATIGRKRTIRNNEYSYCIYFRYLFYRDMWKMEDRHSKSHKLPSTIMSSANFSHLSGAPPIFNSQLLFQNFSLLDHYPQFLPPLIPLNNV